MFTLNSVVGAELVRLGVDVDGVVNAVKSHMGRIRKEANLEKQDAKVKLSKGTSKKDPQEKITLKDTYEASGNVSYPGSFAFFNQGITALGSHGLAPKTLTLPTVLTDWVVSKFPVAKNEETKESVNA